MICVRARAAHQRIVAVLGATALVAAASGCEVPVEGADGSVASFEQALWLSRENFWPNGSIPVCFGAEHWTRIDGNLWPEPVPTGSALWLERTAHIRELLETEYEGIPNAAIDFHGWDACPEAEVGTFTGGLRITVREDGAFTWAFRHCTPEMYYGDSDNNGSAGPCIKNSGYTAQYEAHVSTSKDGYAWGFHYDGAMLHEVGHALSFPHEFDRSDAEPCGDEDPGTATGRWLTVYDAGSVMNDTYCNTSGKLTELDKLGLEIVYASKFTNHPVSGHVSFKLGDGVLLLRKDDAVVTGWTARGAVAGAYENGTATWYRNGVSQGSSLEYDATRLPAGTSQMRATYRDFRGRQHSTVTESFMVDEGLHTAILMTL